METLAPPLNCVLQIIISLEEGLGTQAALLNYIQQNKDSFAREVSEWLRLREQGGMSKEYRDEIHSIYRKTLLSIFNMGLEGLPILNSLKNLETELLKIGQSEIDEYIRKLPIISLIPLLLLQLPALLILILYPLLNELLTGLNS